MIIPISTQDINIGDKVINTKEIDCIYFLIPPGHEFIITNYDKNYNQYTGVDTINNIECKLSKRNTTKKVNIKTAKKEYILRKETLEYTNFISGNCPKKSFGYDDREQYNKCKLKKSYNDQCYPSLECAKYISKEDINKSKTLLKHLRKRKLTNLKK